MIRPRRGRLARSLLLLPIFSPALACGDDGGTASDAATSDAPTSSAGGSTAAATDASTGATGETESDSDTDSETGEPAQLPARFVVTADWLDKTISVLDLEPVLAGASREEALHGVVTLDHAPGPIEVAVTPDGQTALVAVGPGFFQGTIGATLGLGELPDGNALVLVDLPSLSETVTLTPAHAPMGIAISPNGQVAYTANYGDADTVGSTMTIVDLANAAIVADVEVGARPEQVELSPDGALGVINLAGDGAIRVFATADVEGSLSPPLAVSDDPSGVTFVGDYPDRALVAVANSQGAPNYTLVDVSDPAAPVVLEQGPAPGGIPYPVTSLGPSGELAVTSTLFGSLVVSRVDTMATPSAITGTIEIPGVNAFPLGLARAEPGVGLLGGIASGALYVLDLEAMAVSHTIAWPSAAGPSYVAVHG